MILHIRGGFIISGLMSLVEHLASYSFIAYIQARPYVLSGTSCWGNAQAGFDTVDGEWTTIDLPFNSFVPVRRPHSKSVF